jgi:hypothetical protein
MYPLGSGPWWQASTKNAFYLPAAFLRLAPQNPKPGLSVVGGPIDPGYDDWLIESGFLISSETGPIVLRFVADVTDVHMMHGMFCEGLGLRIGLEVCPALTQSEVKAKEIAGKYEKWMTEAGTVDAIEQGYDEPPEDDLVTVRL